MTAVFLTIQVSLLLSCHNIPISQLFPPFRRKLLKSVSSRYVLHERLVVLDHLIFCCFWKYSALASFMAKQMGGTLLQLCLYLAFPSVLLFLEVRGLDVLSMLWAELRISWLSRFCPTDFLCVAFVMLVGVYWRLNLLQKIKSIGFPDVTFDKWRWKVIFSGISRRLLRFGFLWRCKQASCCPQFSESCWTLYWPLWLFEISVLSMD